MKTCLLSGNFALDTIVTRDYPDGFILGKNNKFTETVVTECVDWEGAGDWTTSQFIACLCERDLVGLANDSRCRPRMFRDGQRNGITLGVVYRQ